MYSIAYIVNTVNIKYIQLTKKITTSFLVAYFLINYYNQIFLTKILDVKTSNFEHFYS